MKSKTCKHCKQKFTPERNMQPCCSVPCAIAWTCAQKIANLDKERKKRKREFLDNDLDHWKEKAKKACHEYIRLRDRDLPCVSCGTTRPVQYHASHYRPSGVNSALRYNELNIHKSCAACNSHKSGNLTEYRKSLIVMLGEDIVQWLDSNHETKRWRVDDLKEVVRYYKAKIKEIIND